MCNPVLYIPTLSSLLNSKQELRVTRRKLGLREDKWEGFGRFENEFKNNDVEFDK